MNKIEEKMIKYAFENIKKGFFPIFGSPEIECRKCMFFNIACIPPSPDYTGCFGGWKREKE